MVWRLQCSPPQTLRFQQSLSQKPPLPSSQMWLPTQSWTQKLWLQSWTQPQMWSWMQTPHRQC